MNEDKMYEMLMGIMQDAVDKGVIAQDEFNEIVNK